MKKLGIIAGGGNIPQMLASRCLNEGRPFHVVIFKGQPQPKLIGAEVTECALGQVGKVVKTFKEQGVEEIVMVGNLEKPSLFDLRFDLKGMKILNRLRSKHDDELLTSVCEFLEEEGFHVVGAHEICSELLMPHGVLSNKTPTNEQLNTIQLTMNAVETLGMLDIGQAAIAKDGVVLGLEAVEGTSALIERCSQLRGKRNEGGLLVKAAKPKQDLRVDMPTIGLSTLKQLHKHGYDGVAVLSGQAMFVNSQEAIDFANKHKMFIVGVHSNGTI